MKALPRPLRNLGRAGTALIEFALTAPLLVSLLLSIADLAPSLMVKFKVGTATQAVADLAAQSATIQPADVPNLFNIGSDVMAPFAGAPLLQRISNIASDGTKAFVYWSCAESPITPLNVFDRVTPPTGVIATDKTGTDTSYVIVESQYSYQAPASFILKSAQLMAVTAYTLPRVSTYIAPSAPGFVASKPSASKYSTVTVINNVTCNSAL